MPEEQKHLRFEEEIEHLLEREPFLPFVIILSSGDRHEVTGPRQVAMGGSVMWVVPPKPPSSIFRLDQIVGVEVHEPAS